MIVIISPTWVPWFVYCFCHSLCYRPFYYTPPTLQMSSDFLPFSDSPITHSPHLCAVFTPAPCVSCKPITITTTCSAMQQTSQKTVTQSDSFVAMHQHVIQPASLWPDGLLVVLRSTNTRPVATRLTASWLSYLLPSTCMHPSQKVISVPVSNSVQVHQPLGWSCHCWP